MTELYLPNRKKKLTKLELTLGIRSLHFSLALLLRFLSLLLCFLSLGLMNINHLVIGLDWKKGNSLSELYWVSNDDDLLPIALGGRLALDSLPFPIELRGEFGSGF
jgi:hypothetical protein